MTADEDLPIIALDIDGVLSPILKDEDWEGENAYRWEKLANRTHPFDAERNHSPWIKTDCMDAYVAEPVADFLRDVACRRRARIMWHSTWGKRAKAFEKALNLPSFEVLYNTYSRPFREDRWEKLVDIEALLERGHRVIWLDDHITPESIPQHVLDNLDLLCIAPGPGDEVGLTPNHLYLIDRQLKVWGF
ncbi:MAG: HAD domain-containing protein [Microbacterium gubbeenense]